VLRWGQWTMGNEEGVLPHCSLFWVWRDCTWGSKAVWRAKSAFRSKSKNKTQVVGESYMGSTLSLSSGSLVKCSVLLPFGFKVGQYFHNHFVNMMSRSHSCESSLGTTQWSKVTALPLNYF
jgi:hypothetical protein